MSTRLRGCNDVEVSKVTYEWKIKDFSSRTSRVAETLLSPLFYSSVSKEHQWQLVLNFDKDQDNPDDISLFLRLCASKQKKVRGKCKFFIAYLHGSHISYKPALTRVWSISEMIGYPLFFDIDGLLKTKLHFLSEDTLTVGCELETYADVSLSPGTDIVEASLQNTINSHKILNALESLLSDKNVTDSDVTIVCASQKFQAHKLILAVRSSVFAAMFANEEMIENQTNEIKITDMTPQVVKEMLHFIYTDKVRNEGLALQLLNASEKYQLRRLKAMCELICIQNLHQINVAEMLVWADLYNAEQLKKRALDFICENETEIWTTVGFNDLLESHTLLVAEVYKTRVSKHMNK